MAATGQRILNLALKHVGEKYVFGALAPKNNANWKGPWDCAEFASWLVFQTAGVLYGVNDDHGDPARADAYTGYWGRDAAGEGIKISVEQASSTPGAAVLRDDPADGHIVISDGKGGTVEAMGARWGVTQGHLANRRWTTGILVPGVSYAKNQPTPVPAPKVVIYHVTTPLMSGPTVTQIQKALKAAGFNPGPIDGQYGFMTAAAVKAYQLSKRLIPDGEVGPQTASSLGVTLPKA